MKKFIAITVFLFPLALAAQIFQTESNNYRTFDTVVNYYYNAWSFNPYRVRATVHKDNLAYPTIFFLPGKGEQGTDTNKLVVYGPHFFMGSGWDGGLQLGNGRHYPNYFTIIGKSQEDFPASALCGVLGILQKTYNLNPRTCSITGLSMGAWASSALISYEATPGDETGMKLVKAIAPLSGAATAAKTYELCGHWAKKYGGTAFITVNPGDGNSVAPPIMAKSMTDSVVGSAYFSYNNTGTAPLWHGGWNTIYDPTHTVFWNGPYSATGPYPNTPGTYKNGSSLFQWMLRQGDTSLIVALPITNPVHAKIWVDSTSIHYPSSSVAFEDSSTGASWRTWGCYAYPTGYPGRWSSYKTLTGMLLSNLVQGSYGVQLVVGDHLGNTDTARVTLSVTGPAPCPLCPVCSPIRHAIGFTIDAVTGKFKFTYDDGNP